MRFTLTHEGICKKITNCRKDWEQVSLFNTLLKITSIFNLRICFQHSTYETKMALNSYQYECDGEAKVPVVVDAVVDAQVIEVERDRNVHSLRKKQISF